MPRMRKTVRDASAVHRICIVPELFVSIFYRRTILRSGEHQKGEKLWQKNLKGTGRSGSLQIHFRNTSAQTQNAGIHGFPESRTLFIVQNAIINGKERSMPRTSLCGVGDIPEMDLLFRDHISQWDATELVWALQGLLDIEGDIRVYYTEKDTKDTRAYIEFWGPEQTTNIFVHSIGENHGTIVHEFCHHCTWASGFEEQHGKIFKQFQRRVVDLWYT